MAKHDSIERWYKTGQDLLASYVEMFGDENPFHTNKYFAMAMLGEKLCQERILPGTLVLSVLSKDVWTEFGDGVAITRCDNLKFLIPAQEGAEIGFHYDLSECEVEQTWLAGDDGLEASKLCPVKILVFAKNGETTRRSAAVNAELTIPTDESLARIRALAKKLESNSSEGCVA